MEDKASRIQDSWHGASRPLDLAEESKTFRRPLHQTFRIPFVGIGFRGRGAHGSLDPQDPGWGGRREAEFTQVSVSIF